MQTESRVGVVVEGGQSRKFVQVQQRHKAQIGTVSQLLAGGIAGAVSKTCTAPLARLTILFQVQGMHSDAATLRKPCIWRETSRIIHEEGVRAFWKGNLVTIAHRLPYSSISFYSYERYKNLLQSCPGLESNSENIAAHIFVRLVGGFLSGITAASATYPLDLVRTRLAAQLSWNQLVERLFTRGVLSEFRSPKPEKHGYTYELRMMLEYGLCLADLNGPKWFGEDTNVIYYKGIWHTLRTISKEEGLFSLYKGLGATVLSVGPNIAISFAVYDTLRTQWQLKRPNDSSVLTTLACGSISGIASSSAIFPLDLVRRRMQLQGAGGRAPVYKKGIFGTIRHIVGAEGVKGLYRGILPEFFKVVPSVSIVFITYETMKKLLSTHSVDN